MMHHTTAPFDTILVSDVLESMGWEFVPTGPNEWDWLKFDNTGSLIAREGDATWAKDAAEAEKQASPKRDGENK